MTVTTTPVGINAYGIKIKDNSTFSSVPASASASPTSTQQPSTDSASNSGGLSEGAKAGVGVGAGVGGVLILLLAAFLFLRLRGARQSKMAGEHSRPEYRAELQGESKIDVYRAPVEMPEDQQRTAELGGTSTVELDGGNNSANKPVRKNTGQRFELE